MTLKTLFKLFYENKTLFAVRCLYKKIISKICICNPLRKLIYSDRFFFDPRNTNSYKGKKKFDGWIAKRINKYDRTITNVMVYTNEKCLITLLCIPHRSFNIIRKIILNLKNILIYPYSSYVVNDVHYKDKSIYFPPLLKKKK